MLIVNSIARDCQRRKNVFLRFMSRFMILTELAFRFMTCRWRHKCDRWRLCVEMRIKSLIFAVLKRWLLQLRQT